MSATERTGYRDAIISPFHRCLGFNCAAADIDFWFVEYNNAHPVALIDYKRGIRSRPFETNTTYRAFAELADNSKIPAAIVCYSEDLKVFEVQPLNSYCERCLKVRIGVFQKMNTLQFVQWLYWLRGPSCMPNEVNEFAQRIMKAHDYESAIELIENENERIKKEGQPK